MLAGSHRATRASIATARVSSTVRSIDQTARVSSTVHPAIAALEARRQKAGLGHEELCTRAGIRVRTWLELRKGKQRPLRRTLYLLGAALDGVPPVKKPAPIATLYTVALGLVCQARRIDAALARQASVGPSAAATCRRMAIYLVAVELEVENADLARAIKCSRQNVHQARAAIEELRSDRKVDRLLDRLAKMMTARS